jgi:hypothetical protein
MSLNDYLMIKEQQYFPSEVKEVEDTVDIVPSPSLRDADDFMYSNSEPMSYYARGNGFDLTSNSDLYEIVKVVKDLTDKHFFVRDLVWKANIKRREVELLFTLGTGDEADQFFMDGVEHYIITNIGYKLGPYYSSEKEMITGDDGQLTLKLTIKRNN